MNLLKIFYSFNSTEQHRLNFVIMQLSINLNSGDTKLRQLINELLRVINTDYNKGDVLPSVNQLSKQLGISRDTVFKAYSELKRRKIVDSTPTKGYFVYRELNKVLMLLDFYSPFKDLMYREFDKAVGNDWYVDLIFHHYNQHLFESVIVENQLRYNYFVVMNIDTTDFCFTEVLKKIDPAKLLLLDIPVSNWQGADESRYSHVWQDFEFSVDDALNSLVKQIRKYGTFKLVYPKKLKHPAFILDAYHRICNKIQKSPQVFYNAGDLKIRKGDSVFVLRQSDLYTVLKYCQQQDLSVGSDVGILAYNDIPLYEFVSNGITVISTNFQLMGSKAAEFIHKGGTVKEVIPVRVILRNSL